MDEAAIEKKGIAVLKPEFDRINALGDKSALPALIAYLHGQGISALFAFGSGADFKNAKQVIAQADQGGLSLPDRDYYLKDDPKSVELRKQYLQHVTNMFKLLGDAPDKAAAEATAVMNVETALAKGSGDRVERREPERVYHKMPVTGVAIARARFQLCQVSDRCGRSPAGQPQCGQNPTSSRPLAPN